MEATLKRKEKLKEDLERLRRLLDDQDNNPYKSHELLEKIAAAARELEDIEIFLKLRDY